MILVEIEKSIIITASICYLPGVWSFSVYETGVFFDWFTPGMLERAIRKAGSLTINHIKYRDAGTADPAALGRNQFCQKGQTIYVRNENDNPLWMYYLPKYNAVSGFTDEHSFVKDGVYYESGLDYIPEITDKADNLEYGAMTFRNESIELINTTGRYDRVAEYFGNNIRVRADVRGELKDLCEYYIKNVKIRADRTLFICGDRREKLSQKVPNKKFAQEEFPYIKTELIGNTMQDVYGSCEWAACVCVDEMKVTEEDGALKNYRRFYAARKITKLELNDTRPEKHNQYYANRVWVKQTQADAGESWTPCPIDEAHSDFANGIFALHIRHVMPPLNQAGTGWPGESVPEVYEVRACGAFWTAAGAAVARPLDVIKELLQHYCGIPYDPYWYNLDKTAGIEAEIGGLAPVGIVYDAETGVFEAIEKLQNASDYGFQFKTDYNLFTARRDDNDRAPRADRITIADIVDVGNIEIDMRQNNYATIVDAAYSRRYYTRDHNKKDAAFHYLGTANRDTMLAIYGIDKAYEPETYLVTQEAAEAKAGRLEKFFKKNRVMIDAVEVLNHTDLRVYDIVYIDLRIPIERKNELKQAVVLFEGGSVETVAFGDWPGELAAVDFGEEQADFREFGGMLKCKVMSVKLNLQTMVNTISLLEVG